MDLNNEYLPDLAIIKKVVKESPQAKSFEIQLKDKKLQKQFFFLPGKFIALSVFGYGEMPISISSSPYKTDSFTLTVMDVGKISHALHQMKKGDVVGIRGPFGKGYPLNRFRKKNVVVVAGGCGFAPVGSALRGLLQKRGHFGDLFLFYGAKNSEEFLFKKDLEKWLERKDINVHLATNKKDRKWVCHDGFVTDLIPKTDFPAKNTIAMICGPPVMIEVAVKALNKKGINDDNIFISMERLMHCGVGKCGHCNIGKSYMCIQGPVLSAKELKELPREK